MPCTKCRTGLLIWAHEEDLSEAYAFCLNCSARYWSTLADPILPHHLAGKRPARPEGNENRLVEV